MDNYRLSRNELRGAGTGELDSIEPTNQDIRSWQAWLGKYDFDQDCSEDDFSWFACVMALKGVSSGNFGVGAVLVHAANRIVAWGHNQVFTPYFRSDLHAEMMVVNEFEDSSERETESQGYTLYTSLESCPMCLARLITSRIHLIAHVADDAASGMIHKMRDLPTIWTELATTQIFRKADCSRELVAAAGQIFSVNAAELNEVLRNR